MLCRTQATARAVEKSCTAAGVPTRNAGKAVEALKTKAGLDLLAYCRVVVDPHHDATFLRVLNVPRRGLGKAVVSYLVGPAAARKAALKDMGAGFPLVVQQLEPSLATRRAVNAATWLRGQEDSAYSRAREAVRTRRGVKATQLAMLDELFRLIDALRARLDDPSCHLRGMLRDLIAETAAARSTKDAEAGTAERLEEPLEQPERWPVKRRCGPKLWRKPRAAASRG